MKILDYNTLHLKNKDLVDQMKNLDCNQINIFINLKIIEEEKLYIFLKSKNLNFFLQFGEVTWRNHGF